VTDDHLLLPCHAVIRANGIACESFYPGPAAIGALSATGRLALLRKLPRLAMGDVALTCGATALPILPRHRVRALLGAGAFNAAVAV